MSVTIDHEPLAAEQLGLNTVGQVLARVQRNNRLVTQLLIDGREPDLSQIKSVRQWALSGRTIFIETAEPHEMAIQVLDEVEEQLKEADRLRADASVLLRRSQVGKAMEKLRGCFSTWLTAQDSVRKTAQLLRIDLNEIRMDGRSLAQLLAHFSEQLQQIKSALEMHDFVTLCDVLTYEACDAGRRWMLALNAVRQIAEAG